MLLFVCIPCAVHFSWICIGLYQCFIISHSMFCIYLYTFMDYLETAVSVDREIERWLRFIVYAIRAFTWKFISNKSRLFISGIIHSLGCVSSFCADSPHYIHISSCFFSFFSFQKWFAKRFWIYLVNETNEKNNVLLDKLLILRSR